MEATKLKFKTIDEYHSLFPEHIRSLLGELRTAIKQAAPKAVEVISYNMPAFKQHGVLIYYAVNKNHIGLYPTNGPIKVFKEELAAFKTSKGAIQLPFDKKIPKTLVKKIVKLRVLEDLEREQAKKNK